MPRNFQLYVSMNYNVLKSLKHEPSVNIFRSLTIVFTVMETNIRPLTDFSPLSAAHVVCHPWRGRQATTYLFVRVTNVLYILYVLYLTSSFYSKPYCHVVKIFLQKEVETSKILFVVFHKKKYGRSVVTKLISYFLPVYLCHNLFNPLCRSDNFFLLNLINHSFYLCYFPLKNEESDFMCHYIYMYLTAPD